MEKHTEPAKFNRWRNRLYQASPSAKDVSPPLTGERQRFAPDGFLFLQGFKKNPKFVVQTANIRFPKRLRALFEALKRNPSGNELLCLDTVLSRELWAESDNDKSFSWPFKNAAQRPSSICLPNQVFERIQKDCRAFVPHAMLRNGEAPLTSWPDVRFASTWKKNGGGSGCGGVSIASWSCRYSHVYNKPGISSTQNLFVNSRLVCPQFTAPNLEVCGRHVVEIVVDCKRKQTIL